MGGVCRSAVFLQGSGFPYGLELCDPEVGGGGWPLLGHCVQSREWGRKTWDLTSLDASKHIAFSVLARGQSAWGVPQSSPHLSRRESSSASQSPGPQTTLKAQACTHIFILQPRISHAVRPSTRAHESLLNQEGTTALPSTPNHSLLEAQVGVPQLTASWAPAAPGLWKVKGQMTQWSAK